MTMEQVQIQLQYSNGGWQTMSITYNNPQFILEAMRSLKERFPDKRVRAVDMNERLVDMLG